MENYAVLLRNYQNDKQTFGNLFVLSEHSQIFTCSTLEPPWLNNEPFKSCIPDTPGTDVYYLRPRWSARHKRHLEVIGIPNRKDILVHSGNFYRDTAGCILIGDSYKDIDGDGYADVTNSRQTLNRLMSVVMELFSNPELLNPIRGLPLRVMSADDMVRLWNGH